MTKLQDSVKNWMKAVGQATPTHPSEPDNLTRVLRISLLLEEVLELAEASGVEVCLNDDGYKLSIDDFNYNIVMSSDLVAVADALADIDYVSAGAACAFGLDIEPFHDEVCRSNDSKIYNGYRREDGKWIKGPLYSPANLEPILEAQKDKPSIDKDQLDFNDKLDAV
jgi:predicted HAD superfamily Cof-like phosphohydrolase